MTVVTATTLTATQISVTPQANAEVATPQAHRLANDNVQLAAASMANIPANLLRDLLNMPNSELQAMNLFGSSLVFSSPWWVTDATNIWGTDPADYARFLAAISMAVPIPALSGLNDYMNGATLQAKFGSNGLGSQFAKLLATLMPVQDSCDAQGCVPNTPVSPITGLAGIDQTIWNALLLTGQVKFPMLSGFGQVSFQQMMQGYNFGDVVDPSGEVRSELGITGTQGPNNLMPWSNTTFTLNPLLAFQDYYNHLLADPAGNPVKLPTLTDVGRTMQTMLAGLVVGFDPFTPGSPFCPGMCAYMQGGVAGAPAPSKEDQYGFAAIVRKISDAWPGNTTLETWLTDFNNGTANIPTQADINTNTELMRRGMFSMWDFSNPYLPDSALNYGTNPSTQWAAKFQKMWTDLGLNPDPLPGQAGFVPNPSDAANAGTADPNSPDAHLTNGVYAMKGDQIPALLILQGDYYTRQQAAAYVNAATNGATNTDLTNVENVSWWEPAPWVGPYELSQAIGSDMNPTIYGFSKGAYIASEWKKAFNTNIAAGNSTTPNMTPKFVLAGNSERPNGGLSVRINPWAANSTATPTETKGPGGGPGVITTTDYANQYDPVADAPTNLLNMFAVMNAIMGITQHLSYGNTDALPSTAVSQGTYGDTQYYLLPATTMPILSPVAGWKMGDTNLSAILDPIARVLVESGYNRNLSPGVVSSGNLFYFPNATDFSKNLTLAINTTLDNFSEAFGGARNFGTTPTDVTGQGAYGIGGPPVTPGAVNPNSTAATPATPAAAGQKSAQAVQAVSTSTGSSSEPTKDSTSTVVGNAGDFVANATAELNKAFASVEKLVTSVGNSGAVTSTTPVAAQPPKVETTDVDATKVETPKVDTPKVETPKVDTATPAAPKVASQPAGKDKKTKRVAKDDDQVKADAPATDDATAPKAGAAKPGKVDIGGLLRGAFKGKQSDKQTAGKPADDTKSTAAKPAKADKSSDNHTGSGSDSSSAGKGDK